MWGNGGACVDGAGGMRVEGGSGGLGRGVAEGGGGGGGRWCG